MYRHTQGLKQVSFAEYCNARFFDNFAGSYYSYRNAVLFDGFAKVDGHLVNATDVESVSLDTQKKQHTFRVPVGLKKYHTAGHGPNTHGWKIFCKRYTFYTTVPDGDDPPKETAYNEEEYSPDKINDLGEIIITPPTVSHGIRVALIPGVGGWFEVGFVKGPNSKFIGKPFLSGGWGVGVEAGASYVQTHYKSTNGDIIESDDINEWENSFNITAPIFNYSWGSNYKNWENYSNKKSRKYYDTYSGGLGVGANMGFSFTKGYTFVFF